MRPLVRCCRTITCALLFGLTLSGAAPQDEQHTIQYGCNDVVAIGRVETQGYTSLHSDGDLIGHDRFDMQVRIKKVLRGRETRRVVPASQIAHGELVSNRDFVVVLTPADEGAYTLTSAALWHAHSRPVVAQQCGSPTD